MTDLLATIGAAAVIISIPFLLLYTPDRRKRLDESKYGRLVEGPYRRRR